MVKSTLNFRHLCLNLTAFLMFDTSFPCIYAIYLDI